ncbi:unnamed protein product, partial [Mesorhabditis spiculigera]
MTTVGGYRYYEWGMCRECDVARPLRSDHCQFCGGCCLMRDHHCVVIGCCIGLGTTRYFICMLWHLFEICLAATVVVFAFHWEQIYGWLVWPSFSWLRNPLSDCQGEYTDCALDYLNAIVPTVYYFGIVLAFAIVGVCGSISLLGMQMYQMLVGCLLLEHTWSKNVIKTERRGTTFAQRFRFVMGSKWWLNFLFPYIWTEIEWTDSFKNSILLSPLLEPPEKKEE